MSMPKEILTLDFIELPLSGNETARCVDGRPDYNKGKGPQMLGGSLHPILLSIISEGTNFDEESVNKELSKLREAGFKTGAHRGSHKNPESSDCGFADKMPAILQTAVAKKEEITKRLNFVHDNNKEAIGDLGKPFSEIVADAFTKLEAYSPERITLNGEKLLSCVTNTGAIIEDVAGDHAEEAAFVNLKKGVTFDTNQANQQGRQAFNLDLWAVVEQAQRLGVDDTNFIIGASLILYQATEMVLVEDRGKPALPVVIHS